MRSRPKYACVGRLPSFRIANASFARLIGIANPIASVVLKLWAKPIKCCEGEHRKMQLAIMSDYIGP